MLNPKHSLRKEDSKETPARVSRKSTIVANNHKNGHKVEESDTAFYTSDEMPSRNKSADPTVLEVYQSLSGLPRHLLDSLPWPKDMIGTFDATLYDALDEQLSAILVDRIAALRYREDNPKASAKALARPRRLMRRLTQVLEAHAARRNNRARLLIYNLQQVLDESDEPGFNAWDFFLPYLAWKTASLGLRDLIIRACDPKRIVHEPILAVDAPDTEASTSQLVEETGSIIDARRNLSAHTFGIDDFFSAASAVLEPEKKIISEADLKGAAEILRREAEWLKSEDEYVDDSELIDPFEGSKNLFHRLMDGLTGDHYSHLLDIIGKAHEFMNDPIKLARAIFRSITSHLRESWAAFIAKMSGHHAQMTKSILGRSLFAVSAVVLFLILRQLPRLFHGFIKQAIMETIGLISELVGIALASPIILYLRIRERMSIMLNKDPRSRARKVKMKTQAHTDLRGPAGLLACALLYLSPSRTDDDIESAVHRVAKLSAGVATGLAGVVWILNNLPQSIRQWFEERGIVDPSLGMAEDEAAEYMLAHRLVATFRDDMRKMTESGFAKAWLRSDSILTQILNNANNTDPDSFRCKRIRALKECFTKLKHVAAMTAGGSIRQEPVWYLFYGIPGGGKSHVIRALILDLFNGSGYFRSCTDPYWSLYYGQEALGFDDSPTDPKQESELCNEMLTIVSCNPHSVRMADIIDKGRSMTSKAVLMGTNKRPDRTWGCGSQGALRRRWHAFSAVASDPDRFVIEVNGEKIFNKAAVDAQSDAELRSFAHLRFHPWIFHGGKYVEDVKTVLTYADIRESLRKHVEEQEVKYRSALTESRMRVMTATLRTQADEGSPQGRDKPAKSQPWKDYVLGGLIEPGESPLLDRIYDNLSVRVFRHCLIQSLRGHDVRKIAERYLSDHRTAHQIKKDPTVTSQVTVRLTPAMSNDVLLRLINEMRSRSPPLFDSMIFEIRQCKRPPKTCPFSVGRTMSFTDAISALFPEDEVKAIEAKICEDYWDPPEVPEAKEVKELKATLTTVAKAAGLMAGFFGAILTVSKLFEPQDAVELVDETNIFAQATVGSGKSTGATRQPAKKKKKTPAGSFVSFNADILTQGDVDQKQATILRDTTNRVVKACGELKRLRSDLPLKVHSILVDGQWMLAPAHFFLEPSDDGQPKLMAQGQEFTLRMGDITRHYTFDSSQLRLSKVDDTIVDMALIKLPAQIPGVRSVFSFFPREGPPSPHYPSAAIFKRGKTIQMAPIRSLRTVGHTNWHMENDRRPNPTPVCAQGLYMYDTELQNGDCGSVLLARGQSLKILGFHVGTRVGFGKAERGCAVAVTQRMLQSMMEMKTQSDAINPEGKAPEGLIESIKFEGKLGRKKLVSRTSDLVRSPIADDPGLSHIDVGVAPLGDAEMSAEQIVIRALNRTAGLEVRYEKDVLEWAAKHTADTLLSIQPAFKDIPTVKELLNLNPDKHPGVGKFNYSTGAGYPINREVPAGSGKRFLVTDEPGRREPTPLLTKHLDDVEEKIETNSEHRIVWESSIKDELRRRSKLQLKYSNDPIAGSPSRIVSSCNFAFAIKFKQEYAALLGALSSHPFDSESSVGISVYRDWQQFMDTRASIGRNGFDGDFKGFESYFTPEMSDAIFGVCESWLTRNGIGAGREQRRRWLWDQVCRPSMLVGDSVLRMPRGLPSGAVGTTSIFNCIMNMIITRMAYYYIATEQGENPDTFTERVNLSTFGDDQVCFVAPDAEWFNFNSCRRVYAEKMGIEFTSAIKDEVDPSPLKRNEDCNFLNCTTRVDPSQPVQGVTKYAATDPFPARKTHVYLRTKNLSVPEAMHINADDHLRRTFGCGREVFDAERDWLIGAFKKAKVRCLRPLITWQGAKRLFERGVLDPYDFGTEDDYGYYSVSREGDDMEPFPVHVAAGQLEPGARDEPRRACFIEMETQSWSGAEEYVGEVQSIDHVPTRSYTRPFALLAAITLVTQGVNYSTKNVSIVGKNTVDYKDRQDQSGKASLKNKNDYPNLGGSGIPVVNYAPDLATTENVFAGRVMGLRAGGPDIEHHAVQGDFGTSVDEDNFYAMCQKPSYLTTVRWTESQPEGTILHSEPMTPFPSVVGHTVGTFQPTMLGYLSAPFQYWAGGLTLTFEVLANKFCTGRLGLISRYGSDTNLTTLPDQMSQYAVIYDLAAGNPILKVDIPWKSISQWLQVPIGNAVTNWIRYSMGRWALVVLAELKSPDSCANFVDINIYLSAGKDYRVWYLGQNAHRLKVGDPYTVVKHISNSKNNRGVEEDEELKEAEIITQGDVAGQPEMQSDLAPPTSVIKGPSHLLGPSQSRQAILHHESADLRISELCKRQCYVEAQVGGGAFTTRTNNQNLLPNSAGVNPGSPMSWYAAMFRLWKGDMRYTLLTNAPTYMWMIADDNESAGAVPPLSLVRQNMGPVANSSNNGILQLQCPFVSRYHVLKVPRTIADLERGPYESGQIGYWSPNGTLEGSLFAAAGDNFKLGCLNNVPLIETFPLAKSQRHMSIRTQADVEADPSPGDAGVSFDDAGDAKASDGDRALGAPLDNSDNAEEEWKVSQILIRPQLVYNGSWTTVLNVNQHLASWNVPWDLFTVPLQKHLVNMFTYMRPEHIDITLMLQSQPFQQGKLILYWVALTDLAEVNQHIATSRTSQSVLPHVVVRAGSSQRVTLRIPFAHYQKQLAIVNNASSDNSMGTLVLSVFNPLEVGAAAVGDDLTASVSMTVSIKPGLRLLSPTTSIPL